MQFQLCHENDTSLRLRLDRHHLSGKEEQILSDILSLHPQITGIQIYPATAGRNYKRIKQDEENESRLKKENRERD